MIKLESQYEEDTPKITFELSSDSTLPDLMLDIENFLKAVGYNFKGHLDIVEEE
jgi:hypothetical protein